VKRIRVLVVDDSPFMRRNLPRLLESDPDIEVVGTANNGVEALEKIKLLHPDVVTLDVEMPVLDGLSALRRIMTEVPTPVIMVSSVTGPGAATTVEALAAGAGEVVL
jgi:two-component system, chemotaxis family, protein-glutamate methylesterase/glutaminase